MWDELVRAEVFLTPHASWVGSPFLEKATDIFCDNFERYLRGEPLHGVVGIEGY
jgi:phosphoglycerate dehydrogenase-like enzyme